MIKKEINKRNYELGFMSKKRVRQTMGNDCLHELGSLNHLLQKDKNNFFKEVIAIDIEDDEK